MLSRFGVLAIFIIAGMLTAPAQTPGQEPKSSPFPNPDTDVKLPNGKSQRDAIAKSEYEKSLQDAADLIRLSEDLKAEIEKNKAFVVSIPTIKKAEEIEKLAKRIRSRLTHG